MNKVKFAATPLPKLWAARRAGASNFLALLIALGGTTPLLAQQWRFAPTLEAQATLTNNANYGNDAQREGDLILNVVPGIIFVREGPRFRLSGSASLNAIGYADGTQTSRILPQADIVGKLEAIERLFYVEAALVANQEVLNPFFPQSDDASTFNKYTYVQGRIAPYFQGDFATNWRYLVRSDNSYTYTTQTNAALDDSYYGRHVAEVLRAPTPFGGGLRIQSEVTRFTEERVARQTLKLESALATASYAFTPQLSAGLRGGYERTNYTAEETSGSIYGAEIAWRPNPGTRIEGFWESRFYGPSYDVDFTSRQRLLATNLSLSRSVETFSQLLFELPTGGDVSNLLNAILIARFPDPIERASQVQDLVTRQGLPGSLPGGVNIYSQSVNVVSDASGTVAMIGARNTLALTLYYRKTVLLPDAAVPPSFVAFNDNIQKGASVSLSHRFSPITSLNATVSRLETRGLAPAIPNVTDQNILQVQLNRQLTPSSGAFLGARYQQQDSKLGLIPESDEAAIFVGYFYRR